MVCGSTSEMVTCDDKNNKIILPSSVTSVLSNYDLLFEILLRLPVLSLILFKSVSKNWFNIITSPHFITCRRKLPNIDPPFGLLTRRSFSDRVQCNFESFDIRIPSKKSIGFPLRLEAALGGHVWILQSCNGLILCYAYKRFYVYNPTINQFTIIPTKFDTLTSGSAKIAFDPTKSPHYKIIQSVLSPIDVIGSGFIIKLQTYFSETNSWSVCGDTFCVTEFEGFEEGVYWNDAIHWINMYDSSRMRTMYFKLSIECVLTELELPETFDVKSRFQSKLFESCGCLLILGKDCAHSFQMNVYEMRHGYTEWSVKYIVNLDDILMQLRSSRWVPRPSVCSISVCSIVLGERQEDSFMIIELAEKVVRYNPVLKSVHKLDNLKSLGCPLGYSTFDGFQLIASFALV